jgi:hypothetical protein
MSKAEFKIEPVAPAHYAGVARLVVSIQRDEFGIPATYEEQPDLHDIAGFFRRRSARP